MAMLAAQLMPGAPPLMRISCERYHAMIACGSLTPEDRIELIDGYLVTKMSIGPNHSAVLTRLQNLLVRRVGERAIVRSQNPVTIHEYSEPEPDIAVAKFRDDYYADGHPQPDDLLLIVEIGESSLAYDRNAKIPLYAAAGIPLVWLVDLPARRVTVYQDPQGAAYHSVHVKESGDELELTALPGVTVTPAEIGL
jgi:Uma2 family endonuclease